jgi:hypothetical protein
MNSPNPAMKKHVKMKTIAAKSGWEEGRVDRPLIVISRLLCTEGLVGRHLIVISRLMCNVHETIFMCMKQYSNEIPNFKFRWDSRNVIFPRTKNT